ncbi:helix-turn-helix domain-containing protein [Halosquirtibacter xylanolyticus]|uniref:ligand-binding sensor domain-containing protein n=1 Tax=Halosquirtibacter xylanolyticus TaxID=3374599 RepID=UPI0037483E13|nr:helix-turn-helix domain-containing protein [Prolixibacteraceae bacterium]
MRLRKLIYILILFVSLLTPTFAYNYRFEAFPSAGAFGSDLCTSSTVDRNGFHWIGTNNGLFRWNGKELQKIELPIKNNNLINDVKITALDVDAKGYLWVGSIAGIFRFNTVSLKGEVVPLPKSPVYNLVSSISDLLITPKGVVLVATRNGLLRFDKKQQELVFDKRFPYISDKNRKVNKDKRVITDLMIDSRERLWVSTDGNGVHLFDKNEHPFIVFGNKQLGTSRIFSMYEDFDHRIWLVKSTGLVCLDDLYQPLPSVQSLFDDLKINCISSDDVNDVFVGTDNGIYKYETHIRKLSLVKNTGDQDLQIENDGVLYIGKWNHEQFIIGSRLGIFSMLKSRFGFDLFRFQEDNEKSLSGNLLRVILQDPSTNRYLWIATLNEGVDLLNSEENKIYPVKFPAGVDKKAYSIRCGMVDHHKKIFFGTDRGILRLDRGSRKLSRSNFYGLPISNEPILSMLHSTSGEYWVVGMNTGLLRYNPQTRFIKKYPVKKENGYLPSRNIKSLYQTSNGTLWVGTHNRGICRYLEDSDTFELYSTKFDDKNTVSDKIFCFYEDSRGVLWVGTGKGLAVYDQVNNHFRKFKSSMVEVDVMVLSIQEDVRGRLWIGTNSGIRCIDVERDVYSQFTVADGLQSNVFEYNVDAKNTRYIYMGGNNGLNRFKPVDFNPKRSVTKVGVVSVKLQQKDEKELLVSRTDLYKERGGLQIIDLPSDITDVTVNLAVLNTLDQSKCRFAYQLDGESKWIWLPESQTYVTFPISNKKEFSVKIKSTNNEGLPSTKHITLHFAQSSFTRASWYLIFSILGVTFFVVLIYMIRKKDKKVMDFTEMDEEVEETLSEAAGLNELVSDNEIVLEGQRIRQALKDNVWYLDRNLNKHLFAKHLHISMSHLSVVLRDGLKTNFNDLINGYRIEEVKKRLKDPTYKDYTLLGIAEDCGFNSKTSFYRIFKKYTGVTPTEYIQNNDIRES